MLRAGVLGPLSLVVDGQDRTPTAPKPRQLIAFLVLNANRVVRASECITELWGAHPPKTALSTLQTYVLCTRQLLRGATGDHGHVLITRNQGYQLDLEPRASDRLRFEHLARLGREASAAGNPARASLLLGAALAVWRGPALADVPSGALSSAHVVELEEARQGVLEWRIEADLRLGRHRELLPELSALADRHPTHENVQAQYMLALHRSGRRPEALGVFQRLHCRLGDAFGIEPVPRLRRLYEAIDANDPSLTAPAA
ncbi:AfsR/SARP family transcriptional regulator [Streptomyces sp. LP05-1]|uniref:AfsR/SARP family transcriptional regulator n=1 Tax=Streptomyces pyxinae TaxID=2970734 RepID=A0ABT2CML0_9ACTN|nr:AfsR/SARP family transcriptional regulator [Streptomyces sp. LP05-1]MCS0638645.1 AfsR/SARP family transcriptional regulator [Streptomyces sp. LP05-1]